MEEPRNAQTLSPLPFGIIPHAKKYSEYATNEELAGQVYLYLKEIEEGLYMPRFNDDGEPLEPTYQEMMETNHKQLHKFSAAQAISGLIPQTRFEELVSEYVDGDGRYKKTVYDMMMLRFMFLRNVILNSSLLSGSLNSLGEVEDIRQYVLEMDWIARRADIDNVNLRVRGFVSGQRVKEELSAESAREAMLDMFKNIFSKMKRFHRKELSQMNEGQQKVARENKFQGLSNELVLLEEYWQSVQP